MNKKFYTFVISSLFLLCTFTNAFGQQNAGSLVLTSFADSAYTTGAAGQFTGLCLERGQTVNIKGMYGDLATVTSVNINYTIFASDWSGVVYEETQIFASDTSGVLDGNIDFDFVIPMDADTAGQHDVLDQATGDTLAEAFDYLQVRVTHEASAMLDVFWYEFVNIRPVGGCSESTSVRGFESIEGLEVFPNPASDEITINTPNNLEKEIMVYDVTGKRVMVTNLAGNRLDISSLDTGFHTIRVLEDGKVGIFKLMVQ
ncbi:MAG: T9SS type A sorting domain-containing protein [Bacteroidota bacterium]